MITLSGERGFETVDSWEDIVQLAGFTSHLNPSQKQLKEIIGRYSFTDKITCGLSTCRQPHNRGFIVTTDSGEVSNIGNVCGKKHFGVKFDEYSKAFTRALTDHQDREAITSFLFRIEDYEAEIESIRTEAHGADWVYKTSRALVERNHGCPDTIVTEVTGMIRARDGTIRISRLATADEGAIAGISGQSAQYVTESFGVIQGIACLYPENNLREILVIDAGGNLKVLHGFDVDNASSRELRFWSKWCHELDAKLDQAREAVRLGRIFLSKENLSRLNALLTDSAEQIMFKRWLGTNLSSAK